MNASLTRRSLSRLLTGGSFLLAVGAPGRASAVMQSNRIASGGIGLTRQEFEQLYGPGEPGQSLMVYTDPLTGAAMHAGFDDGDVLDYVWVDFVGTATRFGALVEDATIVMNSLLPVDVRMREVFVSQETPGSIAQLRVIRWTSRSLGEILDDRRSILTTITELPDSGGAVASRLTIVVETSLE